MPNLSAPDSSKPQPERSSVAAKGLDGSLVHEQADPLGATAALPPPPMDRERQIGFAIQGSFFVPENLTPVLAATGEICAYMLPDGRVARLQVVLEIENLEKGTFQDLSTDEEMAANGFACLEYGEIRFTD
jgi:hypothetical protein